MIGLCLLHGGAALELRLPLFFCRHVYKFLLGRVRHCLCLVFPLSL